MLGAIRDDVPQRPDRARAGPGMVLALHVPPCLVARDHFRRKQQVADLFKTLVRLARDDGGHETGG
ncbi:hypothetical protein Atai01_15630 [Amycolatopsis taiwanensis]|uniref:Uncharacterized protein n=1 Tax=Amycolatopsis taiwanensis TaxID=342230 RepID=A0A9W6VFK1_9PSEU|nr:hypothetical protein Atai01_15630 [Amycolatopsis taiwanensis]